MGQPAGTQQHRIAEAVRSLSKELGGMASSSQESGPLTDLAREASRQGGEIAEWLQDKEPTDVLDSVRSYARRRPGTFLVLCGLAGVVAGRLTRSAVATRTSLDTKDGDGSPTPGGAAATPGPVGRRRRPLPLRHRFRDRPRTAPGPASWHRTRPAGGPTRTAATRRPGPVRQCSRRCRLGLVGTTGFGRPGW